MRNWLRSPTVLKLFVGQHILNGLSVAFGVMAVAAGAAAVFGFAAGQPATLGAISASISDFPAPWRVKARTLLTGFGLAVASTALTLLASPSPTALVIVIGLVAFAAGMVTGYGRWALALSAQLLVPMVFVLGLPPTGPERVLQEELLLIGGGAAYIVLAIVATRLVSGNDRRMMASESIREHAAYLRAIARFTDPSVDLSEVYGAAIRQQAALADQLQAARALLLERPRATPERVRLAATIGVLLDSFDAVVAAQCDLPALRDWPAARTLTARIGVALRAAALDLQHLSLELLTSAKPRLPPGHTVATDAMRREAARLAAGDELDPEQRAAAEATVARLLDARRHIERLEHAITDDDAAAAAIGEVDLSAFAPRRNYDPRQLAQQLRPGSPVLRFAVRLTAAMVAGALVAQTFGGGAGHGNWVLLTIAVIMRASYGWTRQRRDDRIAGTLIGCVVASLGVAYLPVGALVLVQGLALALTHGFIRSNYRLASVGASVMALVSLHLVNPAEAAPAIARLADTLVGAAIAHLFSHLWPRWEFAEAPRLATRLLKQIDAFAGVALRPDATGQDYRLERKALIEAIAALSDSAARMGGEPEAAQRGLEELAAMLIAAHGVVAQLSAARIALRSADPAEADQARVEAAAARRWLSSELAADGATAGEATIDRAAPFSALKRATRRLTATAEAYRKAAAAT
ncbi:MAG: FUSC family membrane protein [Roseiarcus sp.]|jgi:uncharacterized membrane protein YccC